MGYVDKLIGRVPVMFVGVGVVFLTGSYRGHEAAGGSSPLLGGLLVAVGVLAYAGLKASGR